VHIRVLKIMSRRPKHLDRVAVQMNSADDPKAARQWYEWSIVEADPGLEGAVWGALQVLDRHGLIWDRGEQLVPPPHGMQHEYEISPTATTSSTDWQHLTEPHPRHEKPRPEITDDGTAASSPFGPRSRSRSWRKSVPLQWSDT
jgi:hypothetical protein